MINKAIDLWAEELSATDDGYQLCWNFLDVNEKTKALRFIQEKHRHHYVISHGKLRMILAAYTDIAPERISFDTGTFGKPFIVEEGKPHKVKFNLSHSDNRMVVAVGYCEHIGIDIEVWNDKPAINEKLPS